MDIVERLNQFLEKSGISKSQFADSCNIPRPTASQILSGRNKKISDEIIAKVHSIYPNLSIMWLMFGEGAMFTDSFEVEPRMFAENSIFGSSSKNDSEYPKEKELKESDLTTAVSSIDHAETPSLSFLSKQHAEQPVANPTSKQITKIVVFYSDNSFEEFFK